MMHETDTNEPDSDARSDRLLTEEPADESAGWRTVYEVMEVPTDAHR